MPRPRFFKLDPAKRARIIEVAGTEFGQKGFKGASLNAILEAAEISKGAFYYYFDDKADLFTTVVSTVRDEILDTEHIDFSTLSADSFWTVMENLTSHSMTYMEEHPWIVELGRKLHAFADDPELAALVTPLFQDAIEITRVLVLRGQEIGEVRTDLPLDLLLSLMRALDVAFDRWFLAHWEELSREDLDTIAHKALDMMRRILAP